MAPASNTTKHIERYELIDTAYTNALDGRDAESVSVLDLLPAIFDAVPDTSPHEIEAALRWAAEKNEQEARELERYSKARKLKVVK